MAKWVKLNVRMQNLEELQRAEELNMPEDTITTTFNPVMVDVSEAVAYCISYNKEGEETGNSEIAFKGGQTMVVEMPFEELDKIIRG